MIKIALFDFDEVLLKPPHYFPGELELRGYPDAVKCMDSYYHGEDHKRCICGKADIDIIILPYLKKFGWQYSVSDFLDQQNAFETQFLNKELIGIIAELRTRGVFCCLATDQDKQRAEYLLDTLNLRHIFDQWFISCFIGYRKIHPEYWIYVLKEIFDIHPDIKSEEIIFFDDRPANVKAAASFDIHAVLFNHKTDVKKEIKSLS